MMREKEARLGEDLVLRHGDAESAGFGSAGGEPDLSAGIIGVSDALRHAVDVAMRVAPTKAAVLLVGESGTGKKILARLIHRLSPRHDRPAVTFDVADVSVDQLERTLVGYADGSAGGAATGPVGTLEAANASTLFVDDIGRLPFGSQTTLLRALEDGAMPPVGSKEPRRIDIRLIAATDRQLAAEVAAGRFRQDLYYRMCVEIRLPPLRERREDIRHLAEAFACKHGRSRPGGPPTITARALRRLEEHRWPGNIRELENVIERAVVLAEDDTIDVDLLDVSSPGNGHPADHHDLQLDHALDRLERQMIVLALEQTNNVKARAARRLGVSERTLWYKLRKHGLF
jgi:DNA-binding NtrC family response regulator